jgi:selenium metabolism protein YedF
MQHAEQILTLVDNETSLTNVTRMAAKSGWQASVTEEGEEYHIELVKGDAIVHAEPVGVGKAEVVSAPLVLVVSAATMGRGTAELGSILVRAFFHTLGEVHPLPKTIIFFNEGVKLACEGSQVLEDIRSLEAQGIQMLVCGTCLGYFDLTEKLAVGHVSNMYDIAETMLGAGKLVNL